MDYLKLLKVSQDLFYVLDELIADSEDQYPLENNAATNIQRVLRGKKVRKNVKIMTGASIEIERVFRGYLGRKASRNAARNKRDFMQYSIFEYYVLQIQKSFRGYYSRKYKNNHASRKRYLQEVAWKGEEVRQRLRDYHQTVQQREEEEEAEKSKKEFKQLTENLHHLLGTQQMRGVLNPPEQYYHAPTVSGVPMEDHIRGAVKDLLRTKGLTKTGLMTGSKTYPVANTRISLQATSHYNILREADSSARVLHRLLTIDPKRPLIAGGKTRVLDKKTEPLSKGTVYMDAWANPMQYRGVPTDQKQFNESILSGKPLFAPVPETPFRLTATGNRSSVLPNDLFDVMATDAAQTGNKGKTGGTVSFAGSGPRFQSTKRLGMSTASRPKVPPQGLPRRRSSRNSDDSSSDDEAESLDRSTSVSVA